MLQPAWRASLSWDRRQAFRAARSSPTVALALALFMLRTVPKHGPDVTKLPSEVRKAKLALARTWFVYWANTARTPEEVAAEAEVAGRLADSTIAALESRERAKADPHATQVQLEGARRVAGRQLTALLAAGLSARVGFALGEPDFSVANLLLWLGADLEATGYRVCDCATVFNPARRRGPERFRCRRCGKTPPAELSDPRVRAVLPTFDGSGSIRRQGWAVLREHHCHTCGAAFLAGRRDRVECDDCHEARRRLKGARPTGEPAEPKHVLADHFAAGTPLEVIAEYDSAVSEAIRVHFAEKLAVYWTARRAGVIPAPRLDRGA